MLPLISLALFACADDIEIAGLPDHDTCTQLYQLAFHDAQAARLTQATFPSFQGSIIRANSPDLFGEDLVSGFYRERHRWVLQLRQSRADP